MEPTLGLVGDLCSEAEWIWNRIRYIRKSVVRCHDQLFLNRLQEEVVQYTNRCLEIRKILDLLQSSSNRVSCQLDFLDELTKRSLHESSVIAHR